MNNGHSQKLNDPKQSVQNMLCFNLCVGIYSGANALNKNDWETHLRFFCLKFLISTHDFFHWLKLLPGDDGSQDHQLAEEFAELVADGVGTSLGEMTQPITGIIKGITSLILTN